MAMATAQPHVLLYLLLVVLIALERIAELALASRNRRRLLSQGGVEAEPGHYRFMVIVHAAFLAACPLEVLLFARPFVRPLAAAMLILLAVSTLLRFWVLTTLGERWTTRILTLPGVAPVVSGPFRLLRHPNYLAVVLEIFALPLVHSAWLSAVVFSLANAWVLKVRIAAEERALAEASGYGAAFAGRPRLVPSLGAP